MSKKVIVFGPWLGEFSYEINWWIPEIRKIRQDKKFKNYKSIAISSKGREILYSDFIDEFIYYPSSLEEQRNYPATFGEHVGRQDIIPSVFLNYLEDVAKNLHDRGYTEIVSHKPGVIKFDSHRTLGNNPYGTFINYIASESVSNQIQEQIKFDNDKDTISILARLKDRENKVDGENWNPKSWSELIQKLIVELDLNIVLTTIKNEKSKGGTFDFSEYDFYLNHSDRIKDVIIDGETAVEKQIAVLQNTTCSIWGGTGAVTLAFFANTPVFTQQTTDNGYRLSFEWQKKLTNNHKNVKIFSKYKYGEEFYHSPVQEMYEKFSEYYEKLKGQL